MDGKQLKNSILHEAIQGRLVPQDASEEPASVLLERIEEERQRLIREKKIKKPKTTSRIFRRDGHFYESKNGGDPVCIDEEIPFEIPNSWEWVRLENICVLINGDRGKNYPAKHKLSLKGEFPFISALNIENGTISSEGLLYLNREQYDKLGNGKLIKDDIVMCIRGSLGKCGIYPFETGAIASSLVILRCAYSILRKYILFYMSSPLFNEEMRKYNNGTAQPNLSAANLANMFIPLPPVKEQKRIVEKLEKLMLLVEHYGKHQKEAEMLDMLLPDALRKAIIQEAIQGKLVPQDDSEEPASVLLERIAVERAKLGKKAAKPMSRIVRRGSETNPTYHEIFADGSEKEITDELPFAIPKSWAWSRLGSVATSNIGLTYKPSDIGPVGVPVYRSNNIQGAHIDLNNLVRVNCKILDNQFLQKGDLLICARNGSRNLVGKNAMIEELSEPTAFGAFMAVCRSEYNSWIRVLLNSIYFDEYLDDSNTTTINQITQKMLLNFIIPIPPHREQKRIVSKIERVLHLVETCRQ